MNKGITITQLKKPWTTESGYTFETVKVAWKAWGRLNADNSNVVLICHALTGHAAADEWFSGLFSGDLFNEEEHYVLCINVPGSCYGSTGPWETDPKTGSPYKASFPDITIRDMVTFQQLLLDEWDITGIEMVVGSSMGGMTAMEFALMDSRVRSCALIAVGKAHSPWAIGISHAQRKAIYTDPKWKEGYYDRDDPPSGGLGAARAMAMLTYRSPVNYEQKFARRRQADTAQFAVESYLNYQGEKLSHRFDALSYHYLTIAMDSHDVSRGRGSYTSVFSELNIPVLIIGISSDLLYPLHEQEELHALIPGSKLKIIDSEFGHDAFLIDFDTLNEYLIPFLNTTSNQQ